MQLLPKKITGPMKRFFLLLLLSFFSVAYSQQSKNRFDEEDRSSYEDRSVMGDRSTENTTDQQGEVVQRGPGNPGDPVPIDVYLPVLLITAFVLIVYQAHKQKEVN